jgi:hypothetical protein
MSDSDMDLPQLNEQDLDMDIDSLDLRLEVSIFTLSPSLGVKIWLQMITCTGVFLSVSVCIWNIFSSRTRSAQEGKIY